MVHLATLVFWISLSSVAFAQPETIIEPWISRHKIPGMFVAVVQGDSVLYKKSFGLADIQRVAPMTATTCMELGSISKVFTAEVIYNLCHQGLLSLQDPIRKYLPSSPASWSGITIQHLLCHTSGLQNYLLDPRFHAGAYFTNATTPASEEFFRTITPDSMVQFFYTLPVEFKPGSTWSYSNTGYYLLGAIGEAVTNKPFFQLVNEVVTQPLGMFQTKANELVAKDGCLATGYFMKDSLLATSKVLHSSYAYSAGAWATTGQDMIRFLKAIHKRRLPSDKAGYDLRKSKYSDELPFTYDGARFYTTFHGMQILSHNGGTPGFSSSWIYAVEKNISIIVLLNRQDYAAIDQLAWDVLSMYEPTLKYPQAKHLGAQEVRRAKKLLSILDALNRNKSYPAGLTKPLKAFLLSENGKGYWRWYFERGFPTSAHCVDVEQIGSRTLYRFLLTTNNETVYRLSVLENEEGELLQIRFW